MRPYPMRPRNRKRVATVKPLIALQLVILAAFGYALYALLANVAAFVSHVAVR